MNINTLSNEVKENVRVYENFYKTSGDFKRRLSSDRTFIKQLFKKIDLCTDDPKVLELGTGTGYYLKLIKEILGYNKVYGTDISLNGLKSAQEKYHLTKLAIVDTYNLAFKQGAFDAVIAIGHNPFNKQSKNELVSLINSISSVIKHDGYFVFIWSTALTDSVTKGQLWECIYNHSRDFIRSIFEDSQEFSFIRDFAFIRPLSKICGNRLLTESNSRFTEFILRFCNKHCQAKLVVIGKKK